MLHLQASIIERIRDQVAGLTTVSNASVLAGLRELGPLLPACIVHPGAGEPTANSGYRLPFLENQEWDVTVIVAHQATDSQDGLTERIIGDFLLAIVKAVHDWSPGLPRAQHQPFRYLGRDVPVYSAGYAEFTLHFAAKAVIGS